MIKPVQVFRLLYINYVLAKHGLDDIIFTIHLFRPFRFLIYAMPWNWMSRDRAPKGQRLREALEDLGPIFIKFGQMLSTRKDLLPENIAEELVALQDKVPPFDGLKARRIIEQAYGQNIEELFDEFDNTPLASASIAQVHTAKLKDGKDIVVKVLRPNVLPVIQRDIAILKIIAKLAERYSKDARRLRAIEIVDDYEKTILDELDLMREAANASQLRRNFEHSDQLYIPEIYWDYTRRNVMAMERIYGKSMASIEEMKDSGVNMQRLSELGVEIFFTQVFTHNFFHADMHPGNLFVDTTDANLPKYIAVDFGIVGTLSSSDQRYLAENFLAFFKRDYNRVAQLHVDSGWVPKGTRVDEFESAIRSVCEPIFERPLKEISFGQLLLRLFQTARRFDMEVQPQLVLLQKTLLNIEGLGRQIYPDLDLWKTAKPFLEKWMNNQVGMRALVRGFKQNLPYIAEKIPDMPELIFEAIKQLSDEEAHRAQAEEINKLKNNIRRNHQQLSYTIIGSCGFISSVIILGQAEASQLMFLNAPVLSWVLAVVSAGLVWLGLRK